MSEAGKRVQQAVDKQAVTVDKIESGLRKTVQALGFDIWGVELSGGRGRKTLRIYIDGPDGVTIDDCAHVSSEAGAVLDAEAWLQIEYSLEVSSPGMDRIFFRCSQLTPYVGQPLSVKLKSPIDGRSRYAGRLLEVGGVRASPVAGEDECEEQPGWVELQTDEGSFRFEFDAAIKVRLVPELGNAS